jgi:alpha-beta hydrolase superfamily lysophospholipase
VYAPIYPQLTIPAINTPGGVTPEGSAQAYVGVLTAFEEYLALYNHGRGFVLLGHSQGSAMPLARLHWPTY